MLGNLSDGSSRAIRSKRGEYQGSATRKAKIDKMTNEILTLRSFGADPANEDNTPFVREAFTTAAAQKKRLYGTPGDRYKVVGNVINMPFQNVYFDGQGCTFECVRVPANTKAFQFYGQGARSGFGGVKRIAGTNWLAINGILDFQHGDQLWYWTTDSSGSQYWYAPRLNYVQPDPATNETILGIDDAIPLGGANGVNYLYGTTYVWANRPSIGSVLRDVNFDGTNAGTDAQGLIIYNATRCTLEKLNFENFNVGSNTGAFTTWVVSKSTFKDFRTFNSGSAGTYALGFWHCTDCVIDNVFAESPSGFGIGIAGGAYNRVTNLSCSHPGGRPIKIGGALCSSFSGIRISNSLDGSNGLAIAYGTRCCAFSDIIVNGATGAPGGGAAIWFSDQHNTDNVISNFILGGSGWGYDITIFPTDVRNVITNGRTQFPIHNGGNASIVNVVTG
jgi:hypothetical protein